MIRVHHSSVVVLLLLLVTIVAACPAQPEAVPNTPTPAPVALPACDASRAAENQVCRNIEKALRPCTYPVSRELS